MKRIALLFLTAVALFAIPTVRRGMLAPAENAFRAIIEKSDMEVLGLPRGVYLEGYGAVFTADVNLTHTPVISPFNLTIGKQVIDRIYQTKLKQMSVLRAGMEEFLVQTGSTLDTVPSTEQIVLVVTLLNDNWEITGGLPAQVYMQAQRSKLREAKAGKVDPKTIVKVQEL